MRYTSCYRCGYFREEERPDGTISVMTRTVLLTPVNQSVIMMTMIDYGTVSNS